MKTDKAWEIWGAQEPYFAVLTDDRYRSENLDINAREAFMRSGEAHIDGLLNTYTKRLGDSSRFEQALDFGCGVGRLVVPLCTRFRQVTGVDVSPSMLKEAGDNCAARELHNATLLQTADFLADATQDRFDLVHSSLVFQHIRPQQGKALLIELLQRLAPGGMAAIQLIYTPKKSAKLPVYLKQRMAFAQKLYQHFTGRSFVAPMEMNPYDINEILALCQDHGLTDLQISLDSMADIRSATVVGVKVKLRGPRG